MEHYEHFDTLQIVVISHVGHRRVNGPEESVELLTCLGDNLQKNATLKIQLYGNYLLGVAVAPTVVAVAAVGVVVGMKGVTQHSYLAESYGFPIECNFLCNASCIEEDGWIVIFSCSCHYEVEDEFRRLPGHVCLEAINSLLRAAASKYLNSPRFCFSFYKIF